MFSLELNYKAYKRYNIVNSKIHINTFCHNGYLYTIVSK